MCQLTYGEHFLLILFVSSSSQPSIFIEILKILTQMDTKVDTENI